VIAEHPGDATAWFDEAANLPTQLSAGKLAIDPAAGRPSPVAFISRNFLPGATILLNEH